MVGHTGQFEAAVKACLGRSTQAVQAAGAEVLITADHGNAEQMRSAKTGQTHTAHTTNVVPLLYVGRPARLSDGVLADVVPTLIALMGLEQPPEMTGRSLVELVADAGAELLEAEA